MTARKTLLPSFALTEVTDRDDLHGVEVRVPGTARGENLHCYFTRSKLVEGESTRRDGRPVWTPHRFNLFPVVLDSTGAPWAEANMWMLYSLQGRVSSAMSTYASIAEDLAAYRRFLDETSIDWLHFAPNKLHRPTYRFNGHLKHLVYSAEIAPSTAKRRMATVIRFYRWLQEDGAFVPENPPWKASDRYIQFGDRHGFKRTKAVTTTDLSIRVAQQDNPYDDRIDDGGKLRPLPQIEQEWLLDALMSLGNTEMTLIHLFGLLTGARIQTILTFRMKHALVTLDDRSDGDLRFPVGPGTGIDTKNEKKLVLHIPLWFYRLLRIYAESDRARSRRVRAYGGDTKEQYLFLTVRGAPFYGAQADVNAFNEASTLRHAKVGQGVRQYIRDYVLPFIREKYGVPAFHYQFHDTRATFGMNLVDAKLPLLEQKEATLKDVMEFVRVRMGHASVATTERYLTYRSRLKMVRAVQDGWEARLEKLAQQAMGRK